MDLHRDKYLQPSVLCDFDRSSGIRARALELARGCRNREEIFQRVYTSVKELPYGLEDWDVPASETLVRGWGMCSGKTNLLVALLRSLEIPARYRVYRIKGEVSLWGKVTGGEDLARHMGTAPVEQDHVDCEVWLGEWQACDPSRDTAMERGMEALGIPLERQAVLDASGRVPYLILATLDDWAKERQAGRRFRENRAEIFTRVNEQLAKLRNLA